MLQNQFSGPSGLEKHSLGASLYALCVAHMRPTSRMALPWKKQTTWVLCAYVARRCMDEAPPRFLGCPKDSTSGVNACTKCWSWKGRRLPFLEWSTFIDMKEQGGTFAGEVEMDLEAFNPWFLFLNEKPHFSCLKMRSLTR